MDQERIGQLITFEGCDGSGKTTQVKLLKDYLLSHNEPAISTKEPGGTNLANKIRQLLLGEEEIKDSLTEFLLIAAARHEHIINFIKPQLALGKYVLCDRFFDSSLVYQGYLKGLDIALMEEIHQYISASLEPSITFLLDLDPQIAKIRLESRVERTNHYDSQHLDFHNKIREGFLRVAASFPSRIVIIDAAKSPEVVFLDILKALKKQACPALPPLAHHLRRARVCEP